MPFVAAIVWCDVLMLWLLAREVSPLAYMTWVLLAWTIHLILVVRVLVFDHRANRRSSSAVIKWFAIGNMILVLIMPILPLDEWLKLMTR